MPKDGQYVATEERALGPWARIPGPSPQWAAAPSLRSVLLRSVLAMFGHI